ncbi:hypothetical protein MED121_05785 [Marinomonas sp. MED121]|nr:hypothetical protein MED121_05785 [Marinomonas sp. MED121]
MMRTYSASASVDLIDFIKRQKLKDGIMPEPDILTKSS